MMARLENYLEVDIPAKDDDDDDDPNNGLYVFSWTPTGELVDQLETSYSTPE